MGRPKDPDKMKNYLSMRLPEELSLFLDEMSSLLGVSKADYVRMMIQANYSSYIKRLENENKEGNQYD